MPAAVQTNKQTVWKQTATVANLGTNDQDVVSRPFAAIQKNMLTFSSQRLTENVFLYTFTQSILYSVCNAFVFVFFS